MSLLMEALKKAEEAKRLVASGTPAAIPPPEKPELSLTPLTTSGSRLPDLALHIDSVDADLAAASSESHSRQRSPAAPPHKTGHHEAADRAAAHNVFAAKQLPRSLNALWIFLGIGALAVLSLGGYFWWQLQAVSRGTLAVTTQRQPPSPPTLNTVPIPTSAQTRPTSTTLLAEKSLAPLPDKSYSEPDPAPPEAALFRQTKRQASPHENTGPLRLTRSTQKSITALENAYDALQAGKMDEATKAYETVLSRDPKNTDALLGMATIAATLGRMEWAHAYYLRALESNPTDATAQAGVISTQGQSNPDMAESRLKTALSREPDSSALLFALGNLYARQNRWSEAQQVFFKAYATVPDNADFIFNLAVSLDHLHKNALATQYYQMALTAAGTGHASFDREQAQNRIRELQH